MSEMPSIKTHTPDIRQSAHLSYRPEIDGLRAIAVMLVVLFHAGLTALSGGYIGVDVFFVISGYLITALIYKAIQNNQFTFRYFYLRRVRRLAPALIAVYAAVFAASFWLFPPDLFTHTAKATIASVLSVSNIFFWFEAGYFDNSAYLKPLLHTWSLSIEEQFYMVWPAIMVFMLSPLVAIKRQTQKLLILLLTLFVISLVLSLYVTKIDKDTAFYLLPFRVFEFAMGAGLVWLEKYKPKANIINEIMLFLGVGIIIYCGFDFDERTRFPGFQAFYPCLGTMLVIMAGKTTILSRLLTNPLMVGCGLISYSLYLVHWPVIVFTRYYNLGELTWDLQISTVIVSVLLATLLYFGVEKPFRRKKTDTKPVPHAPFITNKNLVWGCACLALIICGTSTYVIAKDGLYERYPENIRPIIAVGNKVSAEDVATWKLGSCYLGGSFAQKYQRFPEDFDHEACLRRDEQKPNILLLGDSNAGHLIHGLEAVYPEYHFLQATAAACRPIRDWSKRHGCDDMNAYIFDEFLPQNSAALDAVLLVGRWHQNEETFDKMAQTAAMLKKQFSTLEIIVIGDQPGMVGGVAAAASYAKNLEKLPAVLAERRIHYSDSNKIMREKIEPTGARFVDFHDYACDTYDGVCDIFIDGDYARPVTRDGNHYTPEGIVYFMGELKKKGFLNGFD